MRFLTHYRTDFVFSTSVKRKYDIGQVEIEYFLPTKKCEKVATLFGISWSDFVIRAIFDRFCTFPAFFVMYQLCFISVNSQKQPLFTSPPPLDLEWNMQHRFLPTDHFVLKFYTRKYYFCLIFNDFYLNICVFEPICRGWARNKSPQLHSPSRHTANASISLDCQLVLAFFKFTLFIILAYALVFGHNILVSVLKLFINFRLVVGVGHLPVLDCTILLVF